MPSRMTSRERMLAALHHTLPDRVPVAPWGFGRLEMDRGLGAELLARADPWVEIGLGCNAEGGAAFPMESEVRGNQERRTIHAPGRDLTWVWTTTAQTRACTEYPCKSMEDIEALLAIPYVPPHPDVKAFHALKHRVGQDGLAVMGLGDGLCFPNDMLGTEYCSLLWALEPEVIRHMVRVAAGRVSAVVAEAIAGGVDAFRIVGGEYATQLMGQRAWDELVAPYDRPLAALMHDHGAIVHYHNHGNMQRFLEQVAVLGIDSLDPLEQPPYGDITMTEAAARIADPGRDHAVCLVGGLDDLEVLETESPEEVERQAAALLDSVTVPGFMLGGTSSGIYSEPAAWRFLELVELVERRAER